MKNQTIKLTLPFPPSSNRYWRNFRGRTVKSAEARRYIDQVSLLAAGHGCTVAELKVSLDFYRPQKSGDLDNRIKICLDAMQKVVYDDDKQIVEIHARRFEDKENPRVEIWIEQVGKRISL